MRAAWIASACALACAQPAAHAADPLHSRECDEARAVLEQALEDASARTRAAADALAKARRAAIDACLGREDAARERSGAPYPAIAVSPPAIEVPRTQAAPATAAPAAPLDIPRPAAITTCDPGGCWDSKGRRLNSVGPILIGPRGACSVQSGQVQCP